MPLLPPLSPDPSDSLEVSVDITAARLTLSGELDCCSACRIGDAVPLLALRAGTAWSVDAEGITFCDGAGLAALLDLRERAAVHGATLHLVGASRCVRRLIALVGLTDVLAVEDAAPRARPLTERLRRRGVDLARPPQPA